MLLYNKKPLLQSSLVHNQRTGGGHFIANCNEKLLFLVECETWGATEACREAWLALTNQLSIFLPDDPESETPRIIITPPPPKKRRWYQKKVVPNEEGRSWQIFVRWDYSSTSRQQLLRADHFVELQFNGRILLSSRVNSEQGVVGFCQTIVAFLSCCGEKVEMPKCLMTKTGRYTHDYSRED